MGSSPSRHWVYLDEARTHEVHVLLETREGRTWISVTEFPAGSADPSEAQHEDRPLGQGSRDADLAMQAVEERLALSGVYYKADAAEMKWRPVPPAPSKGVDLRSHQVPMPDTPDVWLRFHHFHGARGKDRLLISMPRPDVADRHVLAEMEFDLAAMQPGELKVLHPRLTSQTLRSRLVHEHLEAPKRGYEKLVEPRDYQRALGERWMDVIKQMFQRATDLVLGRKRRNLVAPKVMTPIAGIEDLRTALQQPRVSTLKRKFLEASEEAEALAGGELAIRRILNMKRRRSDHTALYDLSMLESALLVEYGLEAQVHSLVEEEGAKVLRYVNGYAVGGRR